MNANRVIKNLKLILIILTTILIFVCISFSASYSSFKYNTESRRAVEIHLSNLDYYMEINEIPTHMLTLSPGNNIVNITIESLNDVSTYYKLLYLNDDNINIFYLNDNPYGIITQNEKKIIKLLICNYSIESKTVYFDIGSGYITNTLDDIEYSESYSPIYKKISVGDYIEYNLDNYTNEYNISSIYSGYDNQKVKPVDSKYRIYSINDDGTIDIISEKGLTINENDELFLNGSLGYNNGVYLLNDICNSIYSNSYTLSARNLNIDDIEKHLLNSKIKNNIYTYEYTENTYYPVVFGKNLLRSDNNNLETSEYEFFSTLNVTSNNWNQSLTKEDFKDEIYYDLIMDNDNYWLSSRYVSLNENYAIFGLSNVNDNNVDTTMLYNSSNENISNSNKIRPLITLSKYAKINLIK